MTIPHKSKLFRIGILSLIALTTSVVLIQHLIAHKISKSLKENLASTIAFDDINLNFQIWSNSLTSHSGSINIMGDSSQQFGKLNYDEIRASGLQYWNLIFNNNIQFDELHIINPIAKYHLSPEKVQSSTDRLTLESSSDSKLIQINKVSINNANIRLYDNKKDSIYFSSNNLSLELTDVTCIISKNFNISKDLQYNLKSMSSDSTHIKAGNYEYLRQNP